MNEMLAIPRSRFYQGDLLPGLAGSATIKPRHVFATSQPMSGGLGIARQHCRDLMCRRWSNKTGVFFGQAHASLTEKRGCSRHGPSTRGQCILARRSHARPVKCRLQLVWSAAEPHSCGSFNLCARTRQVMSIEVPVASISHFYMCTKM
jgi:hypothetical protein